MFRILCYLAFSNNRGSFFRFEHRYKNQLVSMMCSTHQAREQPLQIKRYERPKDETRECITGSKIQRKGTKDTNQHTQKHNSSEYNLFNIPGTSPSKNLILDP